MATTTVAASSGGANAKGKLVGKDYITLAIFGVLLFLVFMVFAMVLGMNANLFWFTHACGSLIGGIVWMYVAAKVPKRGAFAIMSAIVAVVALLLGMLWTGPVGIVAGCWPSSWRGPAASAPRCAAWRRSRCGRCASGWARSR